MGDPRLRMPGDGPTAFGRAASGIKRPASDIKPFPGEMGDKGLKYRLWCLMDDEVTEARARTFVFLHTYFHALDPKTDPELFLAGDQNFFEEEFQRQILAIALRDPSNPETPLADVGELRLFLGPHERACLMASYQDYTEERSPLQKIRTAEELDELVAALGEERGSSVFLSYFDIASLRSIARALAEALKKRTSENFLTSGS